MALWLDKHRPKKLNKLDFHKKQADHLEKLVKSGDFPHLLVHGPPGSGKKTRVMALLRELYGNGVDRLRIGNVYNFFIFIDTRIGVHGALGVESTSTFWRLHMEWLF